jgi:hypothetical protein
MTCRIGETETYPPPLHEALPNVAVIVVCRWWIIVGPPRALEKSSYPGRIEKHVTNPPVPWNCSERISLIYPSLFIFFFFLCFTHATIFKIQFHMLLIKKCKIKWTLKKTAQPYPIYIHTQRWQQQACRAYVIIKYIFQHVQLYILHGPTCSFTIDLVCLVGTKN